MQEQARPLLSRGNVIELQGPSGSGKTRLVYDAIISCILPARHSGIELGGWNQAAMVLDTDETFDVRQLCQLLDARINAAAEEESMTDDSNVMGVQDEALRNLHIFRPQSSTQVAATLMHLPRYHWDEPHIQHREIGLLVIDSLSTFYWEDRFTVEQLRGGQSSFGMDARTPFRFVIAALEKLKAAYNPTILLTNWGLNPLHKDIPVSQDFPYFRQHLYPKPPGFGELVPAEGTARAPATSESRQTAPPSAALEGQQTRPAPRALATLPLTHHITLSRCTSSAMSGGSADQETAGVPVTDVGHRPNNLFQGLIRTPGEVRVTEFSFTIHDVGITIDPDDIFRR